MEIKGDYAPPAPKEKRRTFFDVLFSIMSFLLIPFKFANKQLTLIKEDNAKIKRFHKWRKVQNTRFRRGIKLNDEF